MTQQSVFGDAEVSTFICVTKADGARRYYRVEGEDNVELTRDEFLGAGGVEPQEASP